MGTMEPNDQQLIDAIGTQIRIELVRRRMNQQELAAELGMSKATLNRYMRGHRAMPFQILVRVARIFGMPVSALMAAIEEEAAVAAAAPPAARP